MLFDPTPATAGDADVGQNPVTPGFSGAWTSTSSFSASVYPRIEQSQLGYTDGQGASLLTSSGQLNLFRGSSTAQSKTIARNFSLANSLPGMLYISFLLSYNPEVGSFGLTFTSNDGTPATDRTFGLTVDATTAAMTFNGAGGTPMAAGTLSAGTHFVVLQLTNSDLDGGASTTNGDSVRLYLDPTLSSAAANTPTLLGSATSNFYVSGNAAWSIRNLALTANPAAGGSLIFDEIRTGSTWASVTPQVPEPATTGLVLLGLAAVAGGWRRRKA